MDIFMKLTGGAQYQIELHTHLVLHMMTCLKLKYMEREKPLLAVEA